MDSEEAILPIYFLSSDIARIFLDSLYSIQDSKGGRVGVPSQQ